MAALHKKMKFSIKDFFSKCDQIRSFLRIWSHLLKKPVNGKLYFLCSAGLLILMVAVINFVLVWLTNESAFSNIAEGNNWLNSVSY